MSEKLQWSIPSNTNSQPKVIKFTRKQGSMSEATEKRIEGSDPQTSDIGVISQRVYSKFNLLKKNELKIRLTKAIKVQQIRRTT